MSFIRYLANGKQVSFDSIKNDILYAVDKGFCCERLYGLCERGL